MPTLERLRHFTRGRVARMAGLSGAALLVAGSLLLGVAAPAAAVDSTTANSSDFKLAVPPSVVSAAVNTSGTRTMSEAQAAGLLLNKVRYAKGWTALKKKYGSPKVPVNPEVADAEAIANMEKGFKVPATGVGMAKKVVGGAAQLFFPVQIGMTLGRTAAQAFGVDTDAGLCAGGDAGDGWSVANSALAMLTSTDCTSWKLDNETADAPNVDAPKTGSVPQIGQQICTADGTFCTTIVYYQGGTWFTGQQPYLCFDKNPYALSPQQRFYETYEGVSGTKSLFSGGGSPSDGALDPGCVAGQTGTPNGIMAPLTVGPDGTTSGTPRTHWMTSIRVGNGPTLPVTHSLVAGDPGRTITCTVTMADGSTSQLQTPSFTEGSGATAPPTCPGITEGQVPVSTKVTESGPSGDNVLTDTPTTPEYQQWATEHPECTAGNCVLDLLDLQTGKSCFDEGTACIGWFDDPNRASNYSCTYDGGTVSMSECYAYAPTFDPQKVATGHAYADPTTGAEIAGQTSLSVDQETMGKPAVGPDPAAEPRECFPTGWGQLNPVEWVVKPVGCALEWAFVPSGDAMAESLDGVKDAWADTPPGVLLEYFNGLQQALPTLDGCSGPHVDFTIDFSKFAKWAVLHVEGDPLSACSSPWDGIAAATRTLGAAAMLWEAFRAITRYIGVSVGMPQFGKGEK